MAVGMGAAIPGAEVKIVPGMRHMALAEVPEIFNSEIRRFLKSAAD